ncbi:MAG: hypothetical protein JW730_17665 [Anaerolineales bacterium]|nr:hypothetical protein [Anaerolineales bacterium]
MKVLASLLLVLAVAFMQVGSALAAPQTQDDTVTISGTVTEIGQPETDENGVVTVLVTIETAEGPQTVRLSEQVAADLEVGEQVVDLVVNSEAVVPPEEVHPVAAILADFFGEDPSVVNDYHEDGFGFGVIAQAMWMSQSISGDASSTGLILEAKKSGDYSAFTLPDGSTPTNWGQFKKALKENKDKHNLGIIVSGRADKDNALGPQDKGNGKDKNKDKGNGRDKDKNKNKP